MFRKGHRYKHSSVSMNFFQEPEVKEPLNIIQSLPVPNFKDLSSNLIWPKTHVQLSIVFVETLVAVYVFNMGPVSYTHLDVYKRQFLYCIEFWKWLQ